jgi:transcriptional regulator with GAF, ATPase, and Fis domain
MHPPDDISYQLSNLKMRLEQVNRAWTIHEYEALLKFYVNLVPKIMCAERCSIFIAEPGTDRIWLKCGTGLKEKELMPPREDTIVGHAISTGKWVMVNDLEGSPYHTELTGKTKFETFNLICAPIKSLTEQGIAGAIEVLNKQGGNQFTVQDGGLLQEIADYLSMALENILLNQEILQVSSLLKREMDRILSEDIEFVAKSNEMKNIVDTVRVVSQSSVNVLIHGESGTGKELIARMIHMSSDRKNKPFVSVNCASIPENLMESEFFGYEKGHLPGQLQAEEGALRKPMAEPFSWTR